MKTKLTFCSLAIVLASLVSAQPAHGQEGGGIGGLLDWINKMSGPRMVGPAVTGWFAVGEDFALRGSVAARWSSTTDDAVTFPPTFPASRIRMISLQPSLEYRLHETARLGAGLAFHRFGDGVDGFWHPSFPLYAQVRVPTEGRLRPVVSVGAQIFPEFDAEDFAPLTVDVSRDGPEASLWVSAGVEYVWPGG